jgi:hypothetical protein
MAGLAGIGAAALAAVILLAATGCGGSKANGSVEVQRAAIAGTYVMNISRAEMEAMAGRVPGTTPNWGFTRLVLGKTRFRISDRRAPGQLPRVAGYSSGWTSGTYSIRGNRLTFFIKNGYGDTPLGNFPDPPIVVRWSLYRHTLTLQQGKKNEGGASIWLKPWQKVGGGR